MRAGGSLAAYIRNNYSMTLSFEIMQKSQFTLLCPLGKGGKKGQEKKREHRGRRSLLPHPRPSLSSPPQSKGVNKTLSVETNYRSVGGPRGEGEAEERKGGGAGGGNKERWKGWRGGRTSLHT